MSIRGRGGIPALICGVVLAIGVFGWDRWFDQHGKGLFLAAAGVFLVLLEVRSGWHIRELLTTGVRAHGVVVGAEASSVGDGGTNYHARVRFTTRDGQTREFTSAVSHSSEPDVGDPRPVRYRPDDPEQAEVDKPAPWMFFGVITLLVGLTLVVAGVFMFVQGSVPFMDIVVG